ncbi:MAG: DUF72 domain-containing protein [Phycisphaerae bacterium]
MAAAQLHVGTSGWCYAHWAKGRFYPKGLHQGEWLRFYAEQFSTVELNASFYRLPKTETAARWREITGGRFLFAVKLWRRITHNKKLEDCTDELRAFLTAVEPLGTKRGPLLVQLPPGLRCDAGRLDRFLEELERQAAGHHWRVAVEFRNDTWLVDEVYGVLDRHEASVCLADMGRCPITRPNDVDFVYMRRHGPAGAYRGYYSLDELKHDARQVRRWLNAGRDVYIYFNNDAEANAVTNARQLLDLLDGRS